MSQSPLHGQKPELPEDLPDDGIPVSGRNEDDYQYLCRLIQKLAQVQQTIGKNVRYLVDVVNWAFDDDRNTSPVSKLNKLCDAHKNQLAESVEETTRIPKPATDEKKPWWGGLINKDMVLLALVMLSIIALVLTVLVLSYGKLSVTSEGVTGEQSAKVVGPAVPGAPAKQESKP